MSASRVDSTPVFPDVGYFRLGRNNDWIPANRVGFAVVWVVVRRHQPYTNKGICVYILVIKETDNRNELPLEGEVVNLHPDERGSERLGKSTNELAVGS